MESQISIAAKMPIEVHEVISACHVIANQENLDVCVTESLKGAAVAGASAFVCGVLLGPVGVAIGLCAN